MSDARPLAEQLTECEQWCAARSDKEYVPVAEKGLRILPSHHAELAKALPGQEPRVDGWLLRSDVIGTWNWILLGGFMLGGVAMCYVMTFDLFARTDHPFLYASVIFLLPSAAVVYFPLRMIMRRHELVFGDDVLVVRRLVFGRINKEWRLPIADEVRVGLAYRGAHLSGKHGGAYAQLSVVVGSGEAEIVLGDDLDHDKRARLAILIDHYFNGVA
jgi:hypothetical protein